MKSIIFAAALVLAPLAAYAQAEPTTTEAPATAGATDDAKALVQALEAKYARVEAQRKGAAATTKTATTEVSAAQPLTAGLEMLALALVIGGALGAAAWWVKKKQEKLATDPGSRNLAVADALWLGKGQRLVLVEAGGQKVLIGVSSAGMQSLAILDGGARISTPTTTVEAPAPATRIKTTVVPESEEWFSEMVRDEMTRDRPTRDDRRRILSKLNSL